VHRELLADAAAARLLFDLAVLGYDEVHAVLRDRRFVTPKALALRKYGVTSVPSNEWLATASLALTVPNINMSAGSCRERSLRAP
jgi:hypothetical protein